MIAFFWSSGLLRTPCTKVTHRSKQQHPATRPSAGSSSSTSTSTRTSTSSPRAESFCSTTSLSSASTMHLNAVPQTHRAPPAQSIAPASRMFTSGPALQSSHPVPNQLAATRANSNTNTGTLKPNTTAQKAARVDVNSSPRLPQLKTVHLHSLKLAKPGDRVAIILEPEQSLPLLCRGIVLQRCVDSTCYCGGGNAVNIWTDSFGIRCVQLNDRMMSLTGAAQEQQVDIVEAYAQLPTYQQCEDSNTWYPISVQLNKQRTGYQAQYQFRAQRRVLSPPYSAHGRIEEYTAVSEPEPILLRTKDNYEWEHVQASALDLVWFTIQVVWC